MGAVVPFAVHGSLLGTIWQAVGCSNASWPTTARAGEIKANGHSGFKG